LKPRPRVLASVAGPGALAQQAGPGSAVHLPLDHLACGLTWLSTVPGLRRGARGYGRPVLAQAGGKAAARAERAAAGYDGEGPSARCKGPSHELWSMASLSKARRRPARGGQILPKLSNSPFRAPPRNACHSPEVNLRTGPSESLLSRTPISPSGRLATSTQLPLEKLSELFTQEGPEPGRSGEFFSVGLPTMYLTDCRILSQRCTECTSNIT
jgi:hypothetical protein